MSWPAMTLLALLAGGTVVLARRRLLVVTVLGGSMAPTYRPGDRLLVLRTSKVRRGRVVLARPATPAVVHEPVGSQWPRSGHLSQELGTAEAVLDVDLVVKRVAAVAGDDVPQSVRAVVTDATVPVGKLVLLGDSPASADSRAWGFSAVEDVLGVVVAELHRAPTPGGVPGPPKDPGR
jgi:signal peptidase I